MKLTTAAALIAGLLAGVALQAQNQVTTTPLDPATPIAFEAASIKQNPTQSAGSFVTRQPGGRFLVQNTSLRELIRYAWQLQADQVRGGPDWVDKDRWDITAVLPGVPPARPMGSLDETQLATRRLLVDRFKLVIRRETQELPVYALSLARADGKLGSKISPATVDCAALVAAVSRGAPPPQRPANGAPLCDVRGRVGSIQGGGAPMTMLAVSLSERFQRLVIDRTGLSGAWDFTITYNAELSQVPQGVAPPAPDPDRPSLVTALQEQLGLKVDSTRARVDVVVIESVAPPTVD